MRILHVNQYCGSVGGAEVYIEATSKELLERGHQVSLLCGQPDDSEEYPPFEVHQVPGISQSSFERKREVITNVRSVVEKENPDVINIHNINNGWVVEVLQKLRPSIRYLHDHRLFCPRGKYYICGKSCIHPFGIICLFNSYLPYMCYGYFSKRPWLMGRDFRSFRRTLRVNMKLNKLLVASEYMRSSLLQNGFEDEMVEVLPYFTDLPRKAEGVGEGILYVGRLVPEKGVHLLLDALAMMSEDAKLVIVGDGPEYYKSLIHQQISKLKLDSRVRFAGKVGRAGLASFYQACRLAVIPSLWPEPFGIVGIEALSHARPVVAFDSGGISEWLIDGEFGYLVSGRNTRGLAERMGYLLDSPEAAESMGKKGRSMVAERFDKKNHIGRLLHLYEEICG